MRNICPNKNLLEYKKLAEAVGEVQAFRTYVANNYSIPEEFADESYTTEKIKAFVDEIINKYAGASFPSNMTEKQSAVLDRVNIIHDGIMLNPKGTKYEYKGYNLDRVSNKIDDVFGTKFTGDRDLYEDNRQWGNKIDDIATGVIQGKSLRNVIEQVEAKEKEDYNYGKAKISPEAIKVVYDTISALVEEETGKGNVILTQRTIASVKSRVAGTTDISIITPEGQIKIIDIKSSIEPTGRPHGKDGYTYENKGIFVSKKVIHTRQQSSYKKMYDDIGIKVLSIQIMPFYINPEKIKGSTVTSIESEPLITLSYDSKAANKIIDNAREEKIEKLGENEEIENKLKVISSAIKERIDTIIGGMKRSYTKKQLDKHTFFKQMEELLEQSNQGSAFETIALFSHEALMRSNSVRARLDKVESATEELTSEFLSSTGTFLDTFNLMDDVLELIADIEQPLSEKLSEYISYNDKGETIFNSSKAIADGVATKQEAVLFRFLLYQKNKISDIQSIWTNVKNRRYNLVKKRVARALAPMGIRKKSEFAEKFERQIKETDPQRETGLSNKEYKEFVEKEVEKKLTANKVMINEAEKEFVNSLLEIAPGDMGGFEAWVADPRSMSDPLVAKVVEMLDKADYIVMRNTWEEARDMDLIFEEWKKHKGVSGVIGNMESFYSEILEKDENGKATGFLIGEYYSKMKDEFNDFALKNKSLSKAEKAKGYREIRERNKNPEYAKFYKKSDSYLGDDHMEVRLYNHFINLAERNDEKVPEAEALAVHLNAGYDEQKQEIIYSITYRLPAIEKNTTERLKEQGIITAAKEGFKDWFVKDTSYTAGGQQAATEEGYLAKNRKALKKKYKDVILNEAGKEKQFVPVHYRHRLKKQSLQSYDLASIYMMDSMMAENYKQKSNVRATVELIRELASKRKFKDRTVMGEIKRNIMGQNAQEVIKGGIESNTFKVLRSIIEDRVYGIADKDSDLEIGGVHLGKASEFVMKFTGTTLLALNYTAGNVALLQGKIMNFMEGRANSRFVKAKGLRNAEARYWKDMLGIMDDVGRKRPYSITNLLGERFNMDSKFSGIHGRFSQNTKFEQLANMGSLHLFQNGQEHYVQHTLGMSILDGWMIKNEKGEEIKLIDAYEKETRMNEDGKEYETGHLKIKEGWENIVNEDLEFRVKRIISETTRNLHGNYSDQNRAMFQRYVLGKHGIMLRKWMIPGIQKRLKGSRNIITRLDDDDAYESMHYSYILEEFQEGMYITSIRYLSGVIRDMRAAKLNALTANWSLLTEREKVNIRRTAIEIATATLAMAAASILAALAKSAGDDRDKQALFYSTLVFRRLGSELKFYRNPQEALNILRSPAATVSMMQSSMDVLTQALMNPTERYKTGNKERKLYRKARRAFPVTKQFERDAEKTYNLIYGTSTWWFFDDEE